LLSGCTKNSNPTGDQGNLSDPSIKPVVIFTLPANNGVGPFDIYNRGDGAARPSFVVQFNKLMSSYAIKTGAITCEGFDRPVVVVPHVVNTIIVETNSQKQSGIVKNTVESVSQQKHSDKPASYDDVLEFDIFDSLYYAAGDYNNYQMPYAVGKTYTVTIDTSIEDINGNHLQTPYAFSFTPEPKFRVITSYPANNQKNVNITSGAYLELIFNSPLQANALSQIKITPALNGKWVYYSSDSTTVYFSSIDTLKYNTTYSIKVPAGVNDNYGHQLESDFSSSFTATPFEVLSASPEDGTTNISPSTPVQFTLAGPVDTSTIQSAFTISPNAPGSFSYYSYNPTYLTFTPTNSYTFNTKYTVTLSTALKASDGTPLFAPYTLTFTTMPFEVTYAYPSDGSTNVQPSQSIAIAFSGAMDTSSIRSAFSISPSVAGYFSYSGSTEFMFTPTNAFAMGTTYTVTLSTAMKAQDGTHLPSAYSFSFSTSPFQVSYTNPSDGATNWETYEAISVTFNANIDTGSARSAFSISPPVAGAVSFNYYYPTASLTFTPAPAFATGRTYKVTLSTAMKSLGGSSLPSPYSFSFSTVPFEVTSIYPSDGSYGTARNSSIEVDLNAPFDTSTVRTAFSISPSVSGSLYYYNNGNAYNYFVFSPSSSLAASTIYTVTISTALKTSDGTPLSQSYSSSFTTGQY
jgi:hypothetical protein